MIREYKLNLLAPEPKLHKFRTVQHWLDTFPELTQADLDNPRLFTPNLESMVEPENKNTVSKTYILQKDLPYAKAGTEYIVCDRLNTTKFTATFYVPNIVGMQQEGFALDSRYVENNPAWFKLKEQNKEWEIVDCLSADGKKIHPYQPDRCLGKDETVLPCTIYSVRRLSDGEIFSVGDKTNRIKGDETIVSFQALDNGEMIAKFQFGGFCKINFLSKEQSPVDKDAFQWNEKTIQEYADFYKDTQGNPLAELWGKDLMEHFKQSKSTEQPKEEKAIVIVFGKGDIKSMRNDYDGYWFETNTRIPSEKYETVVKAIESCLNDASEKK